MDNELILLQEIKSALWVLIYLIGIGVFFYVIKTSITVYRTLKTELDDKFYTLGAAIFESGDYDNLIEFSHKHLKKKPKEGYGYWFLGKAHFHKKEYDEAAKYFKMAAEIYPTWEKEWVEPYLQKIHSAKSTANKSSNLTGAENAPSS